MSGPSDPPDPTTNAYRRDLADIALAGRVIASHFARPIERTVAEPSTLRARPSEQAEALKTLGKGDRFSVVEDSLGWSWGYGGKERRVGYIRSEALATP